MGNIEKINLLYVITKLELGGAQKQLLSLIKGLEKRRFNVFLFTAKDGLLLADAAEIEGLTIKQSQYLERSMNPLKDCLALMELHKFIKEKSIDIVHTHSSKAGILGRLAARGRETKIILHTVHGWSFNDYQPAFLKNFYIWLEKIMAKFTDRLVVVSNHDKQVGLRHGIGTENKYTLIRYGIDAEEFSIQDNSLRKELGVDNHLLVGTIACLKPQKCPEDFIKLCYLTTKNLPAIKFILVGDGVMRKKIERLILKLGLSRNVILTGWRRDVSRILSALDCFVLTSLWEGLPISVLEAISASKPAVVTNTGGVAEVIENGRTGFLIDPGDIKGMVEKVSMLLKDNALRTGIAKQAKSSLSPDFDLERMARNTLALYENLIATKGLFS